MVDAPGSPCGDQEVYLSAEPGWTYTASSTSIAGSCSATANCEDRSDAQACCSDWLDGEHWSDVDNLCSYLNVDGEVGWGADGTGFIGSTLRANFSDEAQLASAKQKARAA